MTQQHQSKHETELAAARRELDAAVRQQLAGMSSAERQAYVSALPPAHRKLVERIAGIASQQSAGTVRPNPAFAAMDAAWGLGQQPAARPARKAQPSAAASVPRPAPRRPGRALHAPSRHSPDAEAMDRAMGFCGGDPRATAEGSRGHV
ncbi:MAG TPA: hypothetical protein VJV78_39140 [Polyangiales bacterium]|nr:hypothetical protein [Polyangiales bacterium]